VRRSLLPNMPRAMLFSLRGTLPVLDLDGQRIVDSTRIVEELERRYPERALYPEDEQERRRALELEEFFDEQAGHDLRRVAFVELREDPDFVSAFITTGRGEATRRIYRTLLRSSWSMAYANHRYRLTAEGAARSRLKLREALDRITAELQPSGYLAGPAFSIADLTAASLLFPLAWPTELQYDYPEAPDSPFMHSFQEHPAIDWIRDIYARHRGATAEIVG
jgi:glutathione S-transferase